VKIAGLALFGRDEENLAWAEEKTGRILPLNLAVFGYPTAARLRGLTHPVHLRFYSRAIRISVTQVTGQV